MEVSTVFREAASAAMSLLDDQEVRKEVDKICRRARTLMSRMGNPNESWAVSEALQAHLACLVGPTAMHDNMAYKTPASWRWAQDLLDAAIREGCKKI